MKQMVTDGSFVDKSHVKPQEIKTELFPLILRVRVCLSSVGLHSAKAIPGKTLSLAGVIILYFVLCPKIVQNF